MHKFLYNNLIETAYTKGFAMSNTNGLISDFASSMSRINSQQDICDQMDALWDMHATSPYRGKFFLELSEQSDEYLANYKDGNIHNEIMAEFILDYRREFSKLNQGN